VHQDIQRVLVLPQSRLLRILRYAGLTVSARIREYSELRMIERHAGNCVPDSLRTSLALLVARRHLQGVCFRGSELRSWIGGVKRQASPF